jgi:fructose-1,6-bisphosphatase/inositol monophosphatase family enzyme/GNAT superfamily N-acetyltransferase
VDGVSIRPATWQDRGAIAVLIAGMGSHEDVLLSPDPLLTLGRILSDPSSRALVAVMEGRIVGYAELLARPSSLHDRVEGWLGALAVDKNLQRAGIGSRLMSAIEDEARLLGCDEIVLESSSWRNSAHAFYRSIGFRQGTPAERFRRPRLQVTDDVDAFLAAAARAASRVSAVIGPWVGVATTDKAADVAAENAACSVLGELGLPVLAEERGWTTPYRAGSRWICLDAVDGSRNLRAGLPPWAFSAALVEEGDSVAGLVCNLASGRRWWARRGHGARVDGRPASPRRLGLVGTASRSDIVERLPNWVERVRVLGSSTVELCSVADGSLGGFVGLGGVTIHHQDIAAASVILAEAGASLIDSNGQPVRIEPDREARLQVVGAPDHDAARDLLSSTLATHTTLRPG